MRKALPIIASATLLLAPVAASTATAATESTTSNVVTTSESTSAYSRVTLAFDQHVTDPAEGDTFTVSLGPGLAFPSGTDFQVLDRTTGLAVAECTVAAGTQTLTCTVNAAGATFDSLDMHVTAWAQVMGDAIGKDELSVTVNGTAYRIVPGDTDGDGTCDVDCGPIHGDRPPAKVVKYGWYVDADTVRWGIVLAGATDYTVTDEALLNGASYVYAECTSNGSDWQSGHKVQAAVSGDVMTLSAPADETCRIILQQDVTGTVSHNTASVNGKSVSGTAKFSAGGAGAADASTSPTPTATPTEEPTTEPTPEETTPAPEPTPEATTPAPGPTDEATTPTAEPTPEETTPAPEPTPEATTPAPVVTPSEAPAVEPSAEPSTPPSTPAPTTKETPWATPSPSSSPSSEPSRQPVPSPSSSSSSSAQPSPSATAAASAAKPKPSSTPSSTATKPTATSPNTPSKSPAASNSPAGTASPSAASTTAPTTERSLAHTGVDGWLAAFAVVLLACGAGIYVINRPKH